MFSCYARTDVFGPSMNGRVATIAFILKNSYARIVWSSVVI